VKDQFTLIVRCGEVALKGLNKPYFERMLADRIRKVTKAYEGISVVRSEGLIFVRGGAHHDVEKVMADISKVFGVASISPAMEVESDMEKIGEAAVEFMLDLIERKGVKTFKVEAKRADKSFPVKSPDIGRQIGAKVLIGCKVLKVDVHKPEAMLFIDVRKDRTYIFEQKLSGFGGLPLGTNGKGLVLLSGGIDSPVAAWMMAKRGMLIEALHFHSYPYTSERAQEKVEDLARIVAGYTGNFNLHVINLLPIQEAIVANCPEEETTLLVRRFMMKIAERVAKDRSCMMLITGENLGQVASQTAEALVVTDQAVTMPVMRPLIAMDKVEIMDRARDIGTYETSILPYEDCCTVFLPKHPKTKPKLEAILASESLLDGETLIEKALESREVVRIQPTL
jgi:thiamine biosynthesis protein ThiI